ncbi:MULTISPECIES: hypothetical protein [Burkholderia cepacia complex]|jgi:hypothetical protein|uniref:DUF4148 domain-containing protein n=1 Tax=Burkholderia cenocepacia TaxID=95486 RepID=A0ABD4UGB4_9BURK|nr:MULTISPECIES: hypothetical protein [Burkholderia cepacia complex]MCW3696651.1 hypothetical protein [Burkholderia cenocepacia]MCW3704867.1 hypothetical protein [Burkholderia cenocepacia]MCW3713127.1 hypothetical protein [Burkholderia cenocepacia]MCW3725218.1 hypothetical protein [Burkholderia cenocepacia]MCW3729119.1 hypothetical protein [Burkholderia cenocepacia]
MKQQAIFVAVSVAFLSGLIASPAFADADHKYPQSSTPSSRSNAPVSAAPVSQEFAQDGYGADVTSSTQSGTRPASDPLPVDGRSIYGHP